MLNYHYFLLKRRSFEVQIQQNVKYSSEEGVSDMGFRMVSINRLYQTYFDTCNQTGAFLLCTVNNVRIICSLIDSCCMYAVNMKMYKTSSEMSLHDTDGVKNN